MINLLSVFFFGIVLYFYFHCITSGVDICAISAESESYEQRVYGKILIISKQHFERLEVIKSFMA